MLLAVYWGPRFAEHAECVGLLSGAFSALAEAGYVEWRRKGWSRKDAERRVFTSDESSIAKLLQVNRREIDKTPILELGYSFGLWSGGPEHYAYEFSGKVGNTTQIGKNCLLLRLPKTGPLSYLCNESAILALFGRLVLLCNADEGILCEPSAIEWVDGRLSPRIPAKVRHQSGLTTRCTPDPLRQAL